MLELPQVAYRETIENSSEVDYTHIKNKVVVQVNLQKLSY